MAEGQENEDRTEEPTQRKLEEALRRGDVAKSQELPVFLSLAALALAIALIPGLGSGTALLAGLKSHLMHAHLVPGSASGVLAAGERGLLSAAQMLALPLGIVMVGALVGSLVQHRPVLSGEPLAPKLSRISPLAGFKRIFGLQGLVQFLKGVLKIALVGAVAAVLLWRERDRFGGLIGQDLVQLLAFTTGLCLKLLGAVLAVYGAIMAADVIWSRLSWMRRQRMTREELKRESKEQDGNPEIKAKLRQIRSQRLRKRMMAEVPKATVVIANPSHFAVALKYESGMAAPVCVAKGLDALALRIRAVAEENRVPVVENPPLARALHATVEVDAEIPVEHYKAVAEVIGFVLRLNRRAS